MYTGQRNLLQLLEDEQYDRLSTKLSSGQIVHTQNKLIFAAPKCSNNFATIDFEIHIGQN